MTPAQWFSLLEGLTPLLYVATITLLVTICVQAQAILVPLALALMLTFVLTPLVKALERRHVPRLVAVITVVLLTLSIVGALGYVFSRQFNDLATEMPTYSAAIKEKLASLRASRRGVIDNIQKTVDEVSRELDEQELEKEAGGNKRAGKKPFDVRQDVQPVLVVPSEPTDVERLWGMIESIVEPLATGGIVLVLTMFMLMQRGDLRNRFIRLIGQGRVTLTTRTMDEAGQRISRFLLTQSIINVGFGVVVTIGLFCIGIPYAILWGIVAALLRFAPYVGAILALLMPTALAFVLFEGWARTFATLGLFLSLDALAANVVEPLLIGHRTGVSSLALLVSALFWTWLWGPIGLVLSTPIAVCLAVLGKHVPRLAFLSILLGDEPALEVEISFYQRLLAGDEDEAGEIVERHIQTTSREQVFDDIFMPTLLLAERDRMREEITESDQQFIFRVTRDLVQNLGTAQALDHQTNGAEPTRKPHGHIIGVPARSTGDQLALTMLSQLLDPLTCEVEQLSTAMLASEVLKAVEEKAPDLVCITALPPGGSAHVRYLCKRLRTQFPEVRILVIRPGVGSDPNKLSERLIGEGADYVTGSLTEARTLATQLLLPALVRPVKSDDIVAEEQMMVSQMEGEYSS